MASRPFDSGIALVTMLLTSMRILGSCKTCKAGWKGPHLQTKQATCRLLLGKTGGMHMLARLPNMQLQANVSTKANSHTGTSHACMHACMHSKLAAPNSGCLEDPANRQKA